MYREVMNQFPGLLEISRLSDNKYVVIRCNPTSTDMKVSGFKWIKCPVFYSYFIAIKRCPTNSTI